MLSNPAPAPRPNAAAAAGNTVQAKSSQSAIAQRPTVDIKTSSGTPPFDDRKQQKRAANRRSAQLSRKRRKQFIDELREENVDLRRKKEILMSIPDLIVMFDSSGKLWFVSDSVSRFLDFSPRDLEGTSFWERLCDESVRLLKAAFMDALAARKSNTDTPPLGSGVWELRLVDKDGSHKVVTLNGVVHFSGESPECVCSIRPREEHVELTAALPTHGNVSIRNPVTQLIRPTIRPQQSVISNVSSEAASQIPRVKVRAVARRAAQISDGDSGSICSESGSDDV
jgi:PAS domain S-box-containing protein